MIKKLTIGLILTAAGVLLLAFNFQLIDVAYKDLVFSWPTLLIALGLINLSEKRSWFFGVMLMLTGAFFLAPRAYQFDFNFIQMLWPALLIFAGITLMFKKIKHEKFFHHHHTRKEVNDGELNEVNIFGGSKLRVNSGNFKGGRLTNIFGGCKIDLSQAKLAPGRNVLDVELVFGGVSLRVPSDWYIQVEISAVMGGFEDKRYIAPSEPSDGEEKTMLVIKGSCVMGGGEITN